MSQKRYERIQQDEFFCRKIYNVYRVTAAQNLSIGFYCVDYLE